MSHVYSELVARIGVFEVWQLPLTLAMAVLAVVLARYPENLLARFESLIEAITRRPYLSLTLIVAIAIGGPLALRPFVGFPDPIVADEYSSMLQAKTYLLGRLANPALTPNFTAEWVVLAPTYASMYAALRSFPLVVGYAVGIGAWGGVVLSMAALTAAVYWLVSLWLNARYAFVAALLVILRFGLFSPWVNSAFGGAFPALGGVLLLGAYFRLRSRPTVLNGALLGLGLVILMGTRPYEGVFIAAPVVVGLLLHFFRSSVVVRKSLAAPAAIAAGLVIAGFGLTFADNQAITGDWKVSPYFVYWKANANPPALLLARWEAPQPSPVRYDWSQRRRDFDAHFYVRRATWSGVASAEIWRFRNYWNFYLGFALLLPFLLGVWALRREPVVLLSGAALGLALSTGSFDFAQYAAPGFGFIILAVMFGFRSLRRWRPKGAPLGLALSRTFALALVLGSTLPLSSALFGAPAFPLPTDNFANLPCCWLRPRSIHVAVENEIHRSEGRNLVIVDTGTRAPNAEIPIANEPDIAAARTIWVNDDPEFNLATIDRYPDRRIWRLGWLDDEAPCLQLFKPGTVRSGAPLSGALASLPGDPDRGWLPAPAGQCPEGLTRAPWTVSSKR
jgi:hypothetical protein